MNTLSKCALGAVLAAGISCYNANATVSFTLDTEFSGGEQPEGSGTGYLQHYWDWRGPKD